MTPGILTHESTEQEVTKAGKSYDISIYSSILKQTIHWGECKGICKRITGKLGD